VERRRIGCREEFQDRPDIKIPAGRLNMQIEQALKKPMLQELRIDELVIV
jgi:hypothetical protein